MRMNVSEQRIVQTCKERLSAHYGARFKGLILYGSLARGAAGPDSDVDLLVLLDEPFNHFTELETLVDLLHDQQLGSSRYLSLRPASVLDFQAGRIQLYRNARREGIAV
ncbi:MAG: nucleotidyltransferase domain-containing protein [Candidatus Hydrogenedens sp.]|nr:nucleotidyltransferase domain-containing protein [Candidatus Hydrogenedentota bacterium]NLF59461.1 nucleotidyltransferase domain-containing protein [Candidatus Hydrogenedens sp.]